MAIPTLATAPPPPPVRPRVLIFGSMLAGIAGAMTVFTMLGVYLARRADVLNSGSTWLPTGSRIPLPQPNMMMLTLLMSTVTIAWAGYSLRREDRQNAYVALGVTTLLAFGWVVQSTYLFSITKIPVAAPQGQGVLFWSVVGTHFVMVLGGLTYLALMTFRALSGQYRRIPEGISAAAAFWYITVGVYAVIWFAIYITK